MPPVTDDSGTFLPQIWGPKRSAKCPALQESTKKYMREIKNKLKKMKKVERERDVNEITR